MNLPEGLIFVNNDGIKYTIRRVEDSVYLKREKKGKLISGGFEEVESLTEILDQLDKVQPPLPSVIEEESPQNKKDYRKSRIVTEYEQLEQVLGINNQFCSTNEETASVDSSEEDLEASQSRGKRQEFSSISFHGHQRRASISRTNPSRDIKSLYKSKSVSGFTSRPKLKYSETAFDPEEKMKSAQRELLWREMQAVKQSMTELSQQKSIFFTFPSSDIPSEL